MPRPFVRRVSVLVAWAAALGSLPTATSLRAADAAAAEAEKPAADASADVAEWLKYTRGLFEKNHLIARVKLEPITGKSAPLEFRYDRYPELERIQLAADSATFVRKKGKAWIKSADWGESGRAVKPAQARQFDAWCGLVNAPLNNVSESRDPGQGGTVMRLVEQSKEGDNDRLIVQVGRERQTGFAYPTFIFFRYKEAAPAQAHLQGFAGTMYSGADKLMARIRYDYMFLVKMVPASPSPSPSPSAAAQERKPAADH